MKYRIFRKCQKSRQIVAVSDNKKNSWIIEWQKNVKKSCQIVAVSSKIRQTKLHFHEKYWNFFLKSERKFKLLMKIDVLFTFWHSSQQRLRKICTWHLNKLRFVMINWNRSKETTDKRQIFRLQVTQVRNAFKAFLSV